MKALRAHLLNVGLEEVVFPDSLDASENGLEDQLPAEDSVTDGSSSRYYTPWMSFVFTDERQTEHPIGVSFRVVYGNFYNYRSSRSFACYLCECRVSKGFNESGEAIGPAKEFNVGVSSSSSGSESTLTETAAIGDFVRYTGDSLYVSVGLRCATSPYLGRQDFAEIFIERGKRGEYAAIGREAGSSKPTHQVYYTDQMNLHANSQLLWRRCGALGLYENQKHVVAPVYSYDAVENLFPLKRVFSVPEGMASDGAIVELDFSTERKPYLVRNEEVDASPVDGQRLIFEWEYE